jgi:L-glutamine-phosphate cytidylyltransferase
VKAIILAAGLGSRLDKYTKNLPKGMLKVYGKSLIERQIETFKRCSIKRIIIVTGYMGNKINFPDVTYYQNRLFDSTNMVESLMCAREELEEDIIISYGDILFEERVLKQMLDSDNDITVAVDREWKEYWQSRHGDTSFDTESLRLDKHENIIEIGTPDPDVDDVDGRYVGLLKFSSKGTQIMKKVYDKAKEDYSGKPWRSSKSFEQGYMTDLIQEIIDSGYAVKAGIIEKGWLEFDTNEDYEKVLQWSESGFLQSIYRVELS